MADEQQPKDPWQNVIRLVTLGLVALGIWGFVGSTTHVLALARAHGQEGWLAWNVAGPIELLAVLCGIEIQIRAHQGRSAWFPKFGLALTVGFVVLANLAQAEQSPWGYGVAVAAPACFFLAAGLIETRYGRHKGKTGTATRKPPVPRPAPKPAPSGSREAKTAPRAAERRTAPPAEPDAVGGRRTAKDAIVAELLEEARAAGPDWDPDSDEVAERYGKRKRMAQLYIAAVRKKLAEESAA